MEHWTQRTKINDCFSAKLNIEYGIPLGSILGGIIFDINMTGLFYECEENDVACATDILTVISELQAISKKVLN